ncbi:aldo/keto reductase [Paenibacillus roseipurpureus]|uniref:Aldo/keto reductase n=1 Tax=Paenibacillus roseopurpureus TaxID=2918901 RepID=A0AA96RGY1_9BACL|nr:aldo/keto reductase [Paenibacillus sp. MBLB1832]WNR42693.1 aldo/keto reductase [Paenibacillus sp. MBLB1832]
MEYTILGKTGFKVSKIGLGGAPLGGDFGGTTDETVTSVVHGALDLGINFIDTAPLYGRGESERRIGLALKGKRDQVILATKAVMRGTPYSYENTIQSVEESLQRLQTDYIDLIQLHELEQTTYEQAVNEVLPAFLKLKEQGKVRAIGVNAGKLELLMPFLHEDLVDTIQTYAKYTLVDYTAKDELLPLAKDKNIGVIHGSPLAMGILADQPAPFLQQNHALLEESNRRIEQLQFLRKTEPKGLVEPSMRFSLTCPEIAITLTGTTSIRSLQANVNYCDGVGLSNQELEKVFALFPGQRLL